MGELLDNFLKVYQLANFIKHSQIQQQLEQQRLQQQQDERLYQQTLHDFQLGQHLEDIGGTRVNRIDNIQPGFGADILQAGQKRQVTTPLGVTYQVPTFEERQQRLIDMYNKKQMAEAEANIYQKKGELPLTTTPVQMKGLGPFGTTATVRIPNSELVSYQRMQDAAKDKTLTVPQEIADTLGIKPGEYSKDQVKMYEDQYNRTHKADPDEKFVTGVGDNGEVTGAVFNMRTKQWTPVGPAPGVSGKTKTESTKDLSSAAQSSWAQFEKAKDLVKQMPLAAYTDDKGNKHTAAQAKAEKDQALANLVDMRDRIVRVYGNELSSGPSEGGWPDIVPIKRTAAAATNAAPTAAAPSPALDTSRQQMNTALANYLKLTPEQKQQSKNGVTPRQWFIKTFGVDPETIK